MTYSVMTVLDTLTVLDTIANISFELYSISFGTVPGAVLWLDLDAWKFLGSLTKNCASNGQDRSKKLRNHADLDQFSSLHTELLYNETCVHTKLNMI